MFAEPQKEQSSASPALAHSLTEILDRISDQNDKVRFKTFYDVTLRTIDALTHIDLSQEEQAAHQQQNAINLVLQLQTKLTLCFECLNDFFKTFDELFPKRQEVQTPEDDLSLDLAFSEHRTEDNLVTSTPQPAPVHDAISSLHVIEGSLRRENTRTRELLYTEVKEPWLLIDKIAQFLGKMQAGLNEMLFLAIKVFADVNKTEVVPFYQDDIESAVALRQGIIQLRGQIAVLHGPIHNIDEKEAVTQWSSEVLELLQQFQQNNAFMVMRSADKRAIARFIHEIESAVKTGAIAKMQELTEGLMRFLDSLTLINRREVLQSHDHELINVLNKRFDAAVMDLQTSNLKGARHNCQKALTLIQRLSGRDEVLDDVLVVIASFNPMQSSPYELSALIQTLKRRINAITF